MRINMPPATRNLLIANIAIFVVQYMLHDSTTYAVTRYFGLWPLGPDHILGVGPNGPVYVGFRIWQLVTSGFLHGGFLHIGLNMYALFLFGGPIENTFGTRNFVIYYFVCMIVASLAQLAMMHFFIHEFVVTIGASGAIFGLLLAFGMLYPHERLILVFPPIDLPAWAFVTGYGALELIQGVLGTEAGVAHFAHLGGMLGGFLMIQYWRGKFPIKPKRRLMR